MHSARGSTVTRAFSDRVIVLNCKSWIAKVSHARRLTQRKVQGVEKDARKTELARSSQLGQITFPRVKSQLVDMSTNLVSLIQPHSYLTNMRGRTTRFRLETFMCLEVGL